MNNQCKTCGGEIDRALHPRSAYCCAACGHNGRQAAYRSHDVFIVKACPWCGKKFKCGRGYKPRHSIYCGAKCLEASSQTKQEDRRAHETMQKVRKVYACQKCGSEFRRYGCGPKKYCSIECRESATKTDRRTCEECGGEYMAAPKSRTRFCTEACFQTNESRKCSEDRKRKTRKKVIADALKKRTDRAEAATRLRLFRRVGSCADVARQLGESETKTNTYLRMCKAYRRAQKKRSKESKYNRDLRRVLAVSRKYPKERLFCDEIERALIAASFTYKRECPVANDSGRRTDFFVGSLFGSYVVEAKNINRTKDVDCAIGQAMVRGRALGAAPIVAFPSDIEIDALALRSCKELGVLVATEETILDAIQ